MRSIISGGPKITVRSRQMVDEESVSNFSEHETSALKDTHPILALIY